MPKVNQSLNDKLQQLKRKLQKKIDEWVDKMKMKGVWPARYSRYQVVLKPIGSVVVIKEELEESDWQKIFSYQWNSNHRSVLDCLRTHSSGPVKVSSFGILLKQQSTVTNINNFFIFVSLPYKLVIQRSRKAPWSDGMIQILMVGSKEDTDIEEETSLEDKN